MEILEKSDRLHDFKDFKDFQGWKSLKNLTKVYNFKDQGFFKDDFKDLVCHARFKDFQGCVLAERSTRPPQGMGGAFPDGWPYMAIVLREFFARLPLRLLRRVGTVRNVNDKRKSTKTNKQEEKRRRRGEEEKTPITPSLLYLALLVVGMDGVVGGGAYQVGFPPLDGGGQVVVVLCWCWCCCWWLWWCGGLPFRPQSVYVGKGICGTVCEESTHALPIAYTRRLFCGGC